MLALTFFRETAAKIQLDVTQGFKKESISLLCV